MTTRSGTITGIELQQKRRTRVNVFVDNRFSFSLSAVVAEGAALKPGVSLSDEQIEDLLNRDEFQKAMDSALRFLSYRPRSEKEVRQNLARKGFSESFVAKIVARLTDLRLIDDEAFARFWVQNREEHSPRSHRALRFELRAKGVDSDVLEEAIEDTADQESSALAAARKKLRALKNLEYNDFRQRLGGYLGRRGYDYETTKSVVNTLWREQSAPNRQE
ncbi:MAG: RecX family transcriptional regulator [Chloroflexi bacterium]|nr:RecX family transcriptional regulator [Chloroflexota bacterium]